MSEPALSTSPRSDEEAEIAPASLTAGAMIKEARRAAGMHIAALAVALKVPVRKLEALEADDHAALPDIVFVRALASSVCRSLKLDPAPVLALLPQNKGPHLSAKKEGLNAPMRKIGSSTGAVPFSQEKSRWWIFFVVILLLGAAVIAWVVRKASILNATVIERPVLESSSADASATVRAVETGAPTNMAVPATEAPPDAASRAFVSPILPASTSTIASTLLLLRTRGESWVQVKDAVGTLLLQRNIAAGDSIALSGALPLSVIVGRADATEVFVRGKPLELAPMTRDNIARFEVN